MSYDCCFKDYNPYKTPIRTHTKEDEYVREMEYSQDVNGPMPYLIIHHNYGGQWYTYRNYSNEGLDGIPWHLSEDERGDLPDFSINAKYYPTLGICRYSSRNIEIKEEKIPELNDWVVNTDYFEEWYKEFKGITVPAICLYIDEYWCWTTQKPCTGRMPHHMTGHIVFPNIWKPDKSGYHKRDDNWFGESYIEWDNEKYILGDPTELEIAYDALKREFNLIRSTYG